jgi:putative NADH-flavin reductase
MLARDLVSAGHAVRGTTRSAARVAAIENAGAEATLADPDRVATLVGAFDYVSVVCILLGSAAGTASEVEALHGTRLEMLLTKLVDTTARGVVYECRGSVDPRILAGGAERVRAYAERSLAGYALLDADPGVPATWVTAAREAVDQLTRL